MWGGQNRLCSSLFPIAHNHNISLFKGFTVNDTCQQRHIQFPSLSLLSCPLAKEKQGKLCLSQMHQQFASVVIFHERFVLLTQTHSVSGVLQQIVSVGHLDTPCRALRHAPHCVPAHLVSPLLSPAGAGCQNGLLPALVRSPLPSAVQQPAMTLKQLLPLAVDGSALSLFPGFSSVSTPHCWMVVFE